MPRSPLSHPRNRIINFRLTDTEFDELKSACALKGGRCLSDFARSAVLTCAQSSCLADPTVQQRLVVLDERLVKLGDRLQRVLDRLES